MLSVVPDVELIISVGGRLCLLGNYITDLGIEFCDAFSVYAEAR